MIEKVMEFENRLLQDRKALNDLIAACRVQGADGLARMKLQEMQQEVEMLERQLGVLRSMVEYQEKQAFDKNSQPQMMRQQILPEAQALQGKQQNAPVYENMQAPQKPGKDLEGAIGKNMMAVCASVLIFLALITFAAMALPLLGTGVKLALMYTVSIGLAAAGIILSFRKRENKWFLALAGCGMGAVYLSLALSDFYFRVMNDIALYACIFLWAVAICVLSKMRSTVFLVIGQLGVCISVLFGVHFCTYAEDGNRMLLLVAYTLLAELVFYFSHMQRAYDKNMVNHFFWVFSLGFLLPGVNASYMEETVPGTAAAILLIAASYLLIALSFCVLREKKTASRGIFNSIYLLTAYAVFMNHFKAGELGMLAAAVLLLAVLEIRIIEENEVGRTVFQCALFLQIWMGAILCRDFREICSLAVPALGCLIYGFVRNRRVYKITALVYSVFFLLINMNQWLYMVWGAALTLAGAVLLWRYREQYRTWIKAVIYPFFLFFLLKSYIILTGHFIFWWKSEETLLFLWIVSAVNIIMQKVPGLQRNPLTGQREQAMEIETGVIHAFLMLFSLAGIMDMPNTVLHALAILLGAILFAANSFRLLKESRGSAAGIYVGVKWLLLIEVVLKSFETPEFWMSLVGLLLAVLFITAGFLAEKYAQRQWKPLRIFGLLLSMLALAKLILIDIHYDNMLLRSVGFLAAGILCFVISLIYHMVDKRMGKERDAVLE